ncbi:hypothetical protein HMPREF1545_02495 [Oscillibacter sp. KLE 1728]|nr:hypothetical protein HMPREF1545_02495 [Oscillibacter sp. KLE 1728]
MQPEKSRAPFQDQRWRPQFRRLHQTERSRKRKVICRFGYVPQESTNLACRKRKKPKAACTV